MSLDNIFDYIDVDNNNNEWIPNNLENYKKSVNIII